ncbi:unnamed protein product [Rotaria socialis]|uniref:Uncharacterized protein n=2 Tax=Rotaria socialis TaxID=392032 RepID=A0A820AB14_9BILA|nr:unnamed protein product [Rotaria socialis]CAF4444619.1 unnamed protein product [Rotaria socialis]CAF4460994.1 unnamed protein product [Rotaria socialis]
MEVKLDVQCAQINETGTTQVDTISRVFDFDQAQKFIEEFKRYNSPTIPMYNASLSQKIFDRMESNFLDAKNVLTSAVVLLANTHVLSGNTSNATNVRMKLNQPDTKKAVGQLWTVINGKVFQTFRALDQSRSCSSEIYTELNKLQAELIAHGYKSDAS